MFYIVTWWALIQGLGWLALPLAYKLFKHLPDRGYTAAKSLGLLLASYLLWWGASFGFLQNNVGGVLFAVMLMGGLSAWFYFKYRGNGDNQNREVEPPLKVFIREHRSLVLTVELLFTLTFLAWVILRAYATEKIMSSGGEKFMEITFLNGVLNSTQFPPLDPWLSGFGISYYYFGYIMMALLTRLSSVPSGVGFDLYNALLFALTTVGAFGVVYNLIATDIEHRHQTANNRQLLRYGALGSLFIVIMGNLGGALESLYARGLLSQSFWTWIDIPDLVENAAITELWYPGHNWWWWRASRVLSDQDLFYQPIPVNSITEFPFFSFLLGDNHPHVLALPFVLLAIALALNLLCRQIVTRNDEDKEYWAWNPIITGFNRQWPHFVLYALILGALGFLNTWDLPIYLGLTILAYCVGNYAVTKRVTWRLIFRTITLGIGLGVAGILLYVFFYVSFSSQAGGILPYLFPPTRLPQYLVMFGPFIFIITWFLLAQFLSQIRQGNRRNLLKSILQSWGWVGIASLSLFVLGIGSIFFTDSGYRFAQEFLTSVEAQRVLGYTNLRTAIKTIIVSRLQNPWLFLVVSFLIALTVANLRWSVQMTKKSPKKPQIAFNNPLPGNLFVFLLIFIGLALTLSVEFVYLRDNFGVRMNTVFKFYYQGWIMLGCASAYGVWSTLNRSGQVFGVIGRRLFLIGTIILVVAGMIYPLMASYSRVHAFQSEPDLDGTANIAKNNPDDWAAIEWLRANAQGVPVILEAPGRSYNYEGRISAFTGLPTVLGWSLHEGQWRGNYDEQSKREPDIATIYTTHKGEQALKLLHKWQVRYVIVGQVEHRYVEQLCRDDSGRRCYSEVALKKFDLLLKPVFSQGEVTIYQVTGLPLN